MKYLLYVVCVLWSPALLGQMTTATRYKYDACGNMSHRVPVVVIAARMGEAPIRPDTAKSGDMLISVAPNPTQGQLTLQIHNWRRGATYRIELRDLEGRSLLNISTLQSTISLDMYNYSNGVYLLNVYDGAKYLVWKVIKE